MTPLRPGPARAADERRRAAVGPWDFHLDADAVERARETTRRVWRYEQVDHVPTIVDLGPACGESVRDVLLDTDAWFNSGVRRIEHSLRVLQDDYIPVFEPPWAGYFTVPAMLGAELWWENDPGAWPAVKSPLVTDIGRLAGLMPPDVRTSRHFSVILERLEIARRCLPPEVAIGGVDMMSPLGDVQGIMDQTLFFVSLKRDPEAIHRACELVIATQIAMQEATLDVVGDIDRLAAMSNWPIWRPEGAKVLVTDDIAGLLSPSVFERFDKPYGDRLLRRFGGGLRHVCGPHPSLGLTMTGDPPTHGLNCAYRFSRQDLPAIKEELGRKSLESLGRRGHLEVMFERDLPLTEVVARFRDVADALAPDVAAIAYCQVPADGSVSDDEIRAFSRAMRSAGADYARRLRWDA